MLFLLVLLLLSTTLYYLKNNTGGARFTGETFSVALTMGNDGTLVSEKAVKATVTQTLNNSPLLTQYLLALKSLHHQPLQAVLLTNFLPITLNHLVVIIVLVRSNC